MVLSHESTVANGCARVRTPRSTTSHPLAILVLVSIDIIEDGTPCDYCGTLITFYDDDFTICPECGNEFWNMDYTGEFPGDRPDHI